jgi:HAD superfamily hydrolase (TIGR01484 family)
MKTEIKLIAADLDGTCVRYDPRLEVDPVFVEALAPLLTNGTRWVMNSDRPVRHMSEIALNLSPKYRPVALLTRQTHIFLLNESGEYEPHLAWNKAQERLHRKLWDDIEPFFPSWKRLLEDEFIVFDSYVDSEVFAFNVAEDEVEELRERMREIIAPWPESQVSGNNDWMFVLHSSFSKRKLLAQAARLLKVKPEETLAVGDGLNDLSMLDGIFTPHVGCPANSCAEVKKAVRDAGGFLSGKEAAAGSAEVVRHYCG